VRASGPGIVGDTQVAVGQPTRRRGNREITSTEYERRVTRRALVAGLDGPRAGSPTSTPGVAPRAPTPRRSSWSSRASTSRTRHRCVAAWPTPSSAITTLEVRRARAPYGERPDRAKPPNARRVCVGHHTQAGLRWCRASGTSRRIAINDARCSKCRMSSLVHAPSCWTSRRRQRAEEAGWLIFAST
jgi:hypothetical protein